MQGLWSKAKYKLFCYVAKHRDCLQAIDWSNDVAIEFALENYRDADAFIGNLQIARQRRNRILAVAEKYFMENGELIYGCDLNMNERRKAPEPTVVPEILRKYHDLNDHSGIKTTYHAITNFYHGIPRKVISDYIARCQVCMGVKDDEADSLQTHSASEPMLLKRVGVDVNEFGNFWILTVLDYRSWFAWAWAIDSVAAASEDDERVMPSPERCISQLKRGFAETGVFPKDLESSDDSCFQAHEYKAKFSKLGIRTMYPSQRTSAAGPRFKKLHNILKQNLQDLDPRNLAKPLPDLLSEAVSHYNAKAHPNKSGQALSPSVAFSSYLKGGAPGLLEGPEGMESTVAHSISGLDAVKRQVASLCQQIQQLPAEDLAVALQTSTMLSQAITTHVTQSDTEILYNVTLPNKSTPGLNFKTSSADLQDEEVLDSVSSFFRQIQQHNSPKNTQNPLGDLAEHLIQSINESQVGNDVNSMLHSPLNSDKFVSHAKASAACLLRTRNNGIDKKMEGKEVEDECEDEDEDISNDDDKEESCGNNKSDSTVICDGTSTPGRYSLRNVKLSFNLHGDDYYCLYCDNKGKQCLFSQCGDLRRHIEKEHLVVKRRQARMNCPVCHMAFKTQCVSERKIVINQMMRHTQETHGNDWRVPNRKSQKKSSRTGRRESCVLEATVTDEKVPQKKPSRIGNKRSQNSQSTVQKKKLCKGITANDTEICEEESVIMDPEENQESHDTKLETQAEQWNDALPYFCFLCEMQPGKSSQFFSCEESLRDHISIFHVKYRDPGVYISCTHCSYSLKESRKQVGHLISKILGHGFIQHKIVPSNSKVKHKRKTLSSNPGVSFHCFYCNDTQKMLKRLEVAEMKDCYFLEAEVEDHILQSHLKHEDQLQWLPCILCEQKFSSRSSSRASQLLVRLITHMASVHGAVHEYHRVLAYKCVLCEDCSLPSRIQLRKHIEESHVMIKGVCSALYCPFCDTSFKSSGQDSKPVVNRFLRHITVSHEHQLVTLAVDGKSSRCEVSRVVSSSSVSEQVPPPTGDGESLQIKTEPAAQPDEVNEASIQSDEAVETSKLAEISDISFDVSDTDPMDGKVRYHCLYCKLQPPPQGVHITAFLGMHDLFQHFYQYHMSVKNNSSHVKCPICATAFLYVSDRPLFTGIRLLKHINLHHSIDCSNLGTITSKKADHSSDVEHPMRDEQDGKSNAGEKFLWACLLCEAQSLFSSRARLEEHLHTHLEAASMQEQGLLCCPQCNWQTNGLGDLAPSKEIAVYNFVEHCIFSHEFLRRDYVFTPAEMDKDVPIKEQQEQDSFTPNCCLLCKNIVSFSDDGEFKEHLRVEHVQVHSDTNSVMACPHCDFNLIRKTAIFNTPRALNILHETMVSHLIRHHQIRVPSSMQIHRCHICGHETIKSMVRQIHDVLSHSRWKIKTKDPNALPAMHHVSCNACGKRTRKAEIKTHFLCCPVLVYEGDLVRPYQCQHCPCSYLYCHDLWKHMLRAHSVKKKESHPCPECNKGFDQKLKLDMHLWNIHKISRWGVMHLCPECGLEVPKGMMGSHRNSHRPRQIKKFLCNSCGKFFSSKRVLERHRLIHREKVEKCSLCPYQAKRHYQLANHMARVHFINRHPCTMCTFVASSEEKLSQHQDNAHPTQPTPHHSFCEQCQRWFASKNRYQNHMFSVHSINLSQRELIKCQVCQVLCLGPSQLKNHMRMHRPPHIPCPSCNKLFRFQGVLNEHIKYQHSKSSVNLPCHHCNETFPSRTARCRHIARVHGKQRLMPCRFPACTFTTERAAHLTEHMKCHEQGLDPNADQLMMLMDPGPENQLQQTVLLAPQDRDEGIPETNIKNEVAEGEAVHIMASEATSSLIPGEAVSETVLVVSQEDPGIQEELVAVGDATVPASLLAQLDQVSQYEGQETFFIIENPGGGEVIADIEESAGEAQEVYSIVYTL